MKVLIELTKFDDSCKNYSYHLYINDIWVHTSFSLVQIKMKLKKLYDDGTIERLCSK